MYVYVGHFIDERFPCNVLNILDAFSIFNLENVPIDQSSSEFSIYGCSDVVILSKHFVDDEEEKLVRTKGKFRSE